MKRAFSLLLLAALSGCYSGPGTSSRGDAVIAVSTPSTADAGLPVGIVTPKPVIGYYDGIYRPQGAEPCCWLSDRANFQVRVPAKAKSIEIRVFLPQLAVYQSRPEGLIVQAQGKPRMTFAPLSVGEHLLTYRLAPSAAASIVNLSLRPTYSFVPARQHINGDTRVLSMYLRSVTAH